MDREGGGERERTRVCQMIRVYTTCRRSRLVGVRMDDEFTRTARYPGNLNTPSSSMSLPFLSSLLPPPPDLSLV